ncbi:hypothetical protein GOB92_27420 [Sinorhizobium meliloti]|nr:hypothetical protein [Sinorhizobium meliloti]
MGRHVVGGSAVGGRLAGGAAAVRNRRHEDDGPWTVFDIFTGFPAEVNEVEQVWPAPDCGLWGNDISSLAITSFYP